MACQVCQETRDTEWVSLGNLPLFLYSFSRADTNTPARPVADVYLQMIMMILVILVMTVNAKKHLLDAPLL